MHDRTAINMMKAPPIKLEILQEVLQQMSTFVIAVSGGIDSMLLAVIAGRINKIDVQMFHAVSPAVPELATARVHRYAKKENWRLHLHDVGEFQDQRYIDNPSNRCYFCKFNLYGYLQSALDRQIVSGTNLDDLSDFRPGLKAAKHFTVRHPYVEAKIDKSTIRELARHLQLNDLSELPASPCLSSRVETNIQIDAATLRAVDQSENAIAQFLDVDTIRCRVRRAGIVIELDRNTLDQIDHEKKQTIHTVVQQFFSEDELRVPLQFAEYEMGSAFLRNLKA